MLQIATLQIHNDPFNSIFYRFMNSEQTHTLYCTVTMCFSEMLWLFYWCLHCVYAHILWKEIVQNINPSEEYKKAGFQASTWRVFETVVNDGDDDDESTDWKSYL